MEEPRRDLKWQRVQHLRPLKELTLDFQQRRQQAVRFRSLAELTQDFERRRREAGLRAPPPEAPSYDRTQLLEVLAAMRAAPPQAEWAALGISAVRAPSLAPGMVRPAQPCPPMDDGSPAVDPEAKLSRESGADAGSAEMFGECVGGSASERAAQARGARKACASTAASGSEPSERASESGSGDGEDAWEAAAHGEADDGSGPWPAGAGLCEDIENMGDGGWDAWYPEQDWYIEQDCPDFQGLSSGYPESWCWNGGDWDSGFVHAAHAYSDHECFVSGPWLDHSPAFFAGLHGAEAAADVTSASC